MELKLHENSWLYRCGDANPILDLSLTPGSWPLDSFRGCWSVFVWCSQAFDVVCAHSVSYPESLLSYRQGLLSYPIPAPEGSGDQGGNSHHNREHLWTETPPPPYSTSCYHAPQGQYLSDLTIIGSSWWHNKQPHFIVEGYKKPLKCTEKAFCCLFFSENMLHCTCVLASLGQLCCIAQAEMTLKPLTTMESGSSEDRYSALDSGYWFTFLLLLTSTRILPEGQKDKHTWLE